jgi:signal transduction histidine kinase
LQDIELPAPIALLVFHIAREGIMNAVKHADPTDVSVSVTEQGEDIVLQLTTMFRGSMPALPVPRATTGWR